MDELKNENPDNLVYIDESGIDDNETYDYAWSLKGQRVYDMKNSARKKRLSIISALNQNKLKAPFVFEGMCNRTVFEIYVEKVLVPELKPGQTVIMDNAAFHKGGIIKHLIEKAGCYLKYLPPYSPDLNPIEHYWNSIKHRIKQHLLLCNRNLYMAAQYAF
jgi:transposase